MKRLIQITFVAIVACLLFSCQREVKNDVDPFIAQVNSLIDVQAKTLKPEIDGERLMAESGSVEAAEVSALTVDKISRMNKEVLPKFKEVAFYQYQPNGSLEFLRSGANKDGTFDPDVEICISPVGEASRTGYSNPNYLEELIQLSKTQARTTVQFNIVDDGSNELSSSAWSTLLLYHQAQGVYLKNSQSKVFTIVSLIDRCPSKPTAPQPLKNSDILDLVE